MSSLAFLDGALPKCLFALLNLYLGYKLGQYSASSDSKLDLDEDADESSGDKSEKPSTHAQESDKREEADDEIGDIADGDLSAIRAGFTEPCKMVLVVRTDLKMDSGTIASLCSKATLACYKALSSKNPQLLKHWERTGQAKIALKGKGAEQLLELEAIAKSLNLCARSVYTEAQIKPVDGEHERAVLAIGPAPVPVVNEVTGSLRLL